MQVRTGCPSGVMDIVVAPPVAKLAAQLACCRINVAAGMHEAHWTLAIDAIASVVFFAEGPASS